MYIDNDVILAMIDDFLNGRQPFSDEYETDDPYMCRIITEAEDTKQEGRSFVKKINTSSQVKSVDSKTS